MSRSAYFNKEAQDALVEGVNLVADCVKSTIGPAGTTVVIQAEEGKPVRVTKDGISVAKSISPKDEKVKLGADLAISVAQKQLDSVGDGTSTATILAQAIINAGVRQLELADKDINRTLFRKGIEKARDFTINALDAASKTIDSDKQLDYVATVSVNGDEKLGSIVSEAYRKVGKDGVVLVEETKDRDIRLEFKEGMTFDKGWTSQFFVNNHESQTVEFDNPTVILCNSKVSNFTTLANLIQPVITRGNPIVVIAESFDSSVTQALAMNIFRSNGQFKIACVEAPSYGDARLNRLRDMAIYLGAKVGDDPIDVKFEAMSELDFGSCEKIIIKRDETIISGGKGDPERIAARVEAIKGEIKALKENATWEKDVLNKRLAALTTGVAVIKVGGSSETEIGELRDKLEDCQYAVKAALEEGYLPGGGTTLLHLSQVVASDVTSDNDDVQMGITIFASALKAPFKRILENAGVYPETVIPEILEHGMNIGYNAATLNVADMIEDGILDPTKAVKGAIYAATSIASVALTSSVVICNDPIENNGVSLNMVPQMPM